MTWAKIITPGFIGFTIEAETPSPLVSMITFGENLNHEEVPLYLNHCWPFWAITKPDGRKRRRTTITSNVASRQRQWGSGRKSKLK